MDIVKKIKKELKKQKWNNEIANKEIASDVIDEALI